MTEVIVRPLAEADLDEGAGWYLPVAPNKVGDFLNDFDNILSTIEKFPRLWPKTEGIIRRAPFVHFPYSAWYVYLKDVDENNADVANIIAVTNDLRDSAENAHRVKQANQSR